MIEKFTIETLYLDGCPFSEVLVPSRDQFPDVELGIDDDYAELDDAWLVALQRLSENMDSSACVSCHGAVGFALHENDDYPQQSGLRWEITILARQDGGPVLALCEACYPSLQIFAEVDE